MPIVKQMAETPAPTLETELHSGAFTEEEQSEILNEIETAASSAHMQAATVLEAFQPAKRGVLFPVVINLMAVALVVGAWFGAQAYFTNRQDGLKIKTTQLFGAESSLLAKVLEDSKAQLDAKNAEIGSIQANLDKLSQEKNLLVANFDSQLKAKESALRADVAKQLEAEKARLLGLGVSKSDISAKLSEFESQRTAELKQALDNYKKSAQAEIDQRTKEVDSLQAKVASAQAETAKLKADYDKQNLAREKDLRGQFSIQLASLDKLSQERDELTLFFRQTDAQYASVRTALLGGDVAKAQASVGLLKGVLKTGAASMTEVVRQRSQADLVLAVALESAVNQLADSAKKPDADPKYEAFKAAVRRAGTAPVEERSALMSKALANLPEVDAAVTLVQAWESQKAAAQLADKLKAAETQRLREVSSLNTTVSDREKDLSLLRSQWAELTSKAESSDANLVSISGILKQQVSDLQKQLTDLESQVKVLVAEKAQWKALSALYEASRDQVLASLVDPKNADFGSAKTLFLQPFTSDSGKQFFPDYTATFDALVAKLSPIPAAAISPVDQMAKGRQQAFKDVLLFTSYLRGEAGTAASPKDAQASTEKLFRTDDGYKEVVDAIQKLTQSGAKETILQTDKFKLLGAVLSRSGLHLTIEPLTAAGATVGQSVEVRRSSGKTETVLARGIITVVGTKKIEADLATASAPRTEPAAGDTVYLILN